MKAAYVNTTTNIVEGVIIVNSLEDPVPETHRIVALEMVPDMSNPDVAELTAILKQIDPDYQPAYEAMVELPINPGQAMWTEATGYTDLDGNPLYSK